MNLDNHIHFCINLSLGDGTLILLCGDVDLWALSSFESKSFNGMSNGSERWMPASKYMLVTSEDISNITISEYVNIQGFDYLVMLNYLLLKLDFFIKVLKYF